MPFIYIGILGFILFFIYDINSILWNNKILHHFFFIGNVLLCVSTSSLIVLTRGNVLGFKVVSILFIVLAAIFLFLLIFSLFFALPFKETYTENTETPRIYTNGIYAICRHPGVLWFIGFYFSLYMVFPNFLMLLAAIVFSVCNIFYIILQDFWTFPKTFANYNDYKKNTPFLIPNSRSFSKCIHTLKRKQVYHEFKE